MTIQISVVIWTVICFLLLVLILRSLLFRPMLELMDRRKERIRKAEARKAEYERLAQEYASALEEEKSAYQKQQQKEMREQIEQIRLEGKSRLDEANEERLRRVDRDRLKAEEECAQLLTLLSARAGELAVSFAESLVKE